MADYKQAGDLVPGDVYVEHNHRRRRPQTYRVIATNPNRVSTIIEVTVESILRPGHLHTTNFFRINRVEMADSRNLHFVRLAGED
jgi:hypothetical protein